MASEGEVQGYGEVPKAAQILLSFDVKPNKSTRPCLEWFVCTIETCGMQVNLGVGQNGDQQELGWFKVTRIYIAGLWVSLQAEF